MNIHISREGLEQSLSDWNNNSKVQLNEKSLKKLFRETYPLNHDVEEINIKVSALNTLYSTQLRSYTFNVTQHIYALKIDRRLQEGDITLIDDIIKTPRGEGKYFRCYSFATKYCSFHRPDVYPIYDSYVDGLLQFLQERDKFAGEVKVNNRDYSTYVSTIKAFQKYYHLEDCDLKSVDKYLWQLGYELKQSLNMTV